MTNRFIELHRFAGSRAALAAVLTIVTAVFVLVRLQYWIEAPFPRFTPDSETYLAVTFDIANGIWPIFDMRTPGYPVLLYLVLQTTDSIYAVVLLQQFATLLSAYMICVSCFMVRRPLVLVSLIPGVAIVGSQQALFHELSIMAETVYAAATTLAFSTLLVGLVRRSSGWLLASLLAMGAAILLRPSGLFLAGTYVLVLIAMWACRFGWARILNFAAPLPAVVVALCAYNYATLGKFTVSPFGPANLVGVVATFVREMPDFPPSVNAAIREFEKGVSPEERATLKSDWNAWRLTAVYHHHYNRFVWFTIAPALDEVGIKGTMAQAPHLAKLSKYAISQDVPAYAKFVYASLYVLLGGVGRDESDGQRVNYERLYGEDRYLKAGTTPWFRSQLRGLQNNDQIAAFRRFALREYNGAPPTNRVLPPLVPHGLAKAIADHPEGFSQWTKLANWYNVTVHAPIFVNTGWIAAPLFLALLSVFVLFRYRAPDVVAVASIGLIAPLSLFGASLMTALVEEGLDRYVYPTRFLFYLAPVLMVAVWLEVRSRSDRTSTS
jgi:hypothetical protein